MRLTITQSQGRFLPLLFYSVALVLILLQLDRSRHRLAWSRERLAWSEARAARSAEIAALSGNLDEDMRIQREKMFADPAMKLKVSHDSAALSQGYLNNAYADLREAQKELYERESLTWLDQLTPWLSISLMLLGTGISVYTARKFSRK